MDAKERDLRDRITGLEKELEKKDRMIQVILANPRLREDHVNDRLKLRQTEFHNSKGRTCLLMFDIETENTLTDNVFITTTKLKNIVAYVPDTLGDNYRISEPMGIFEGETWEDIVYRIISIFYWH